MTFNPQQPMTYAGAAVDADSQGEQSYKRPPTYGRPLTRAPMGLVGRGGFLLQQFADDLSRSFGGPPMGKAKQKRLNRNRRGKFYKDPEGGHFDVSLVDDEGRPTGYIARVTVSYVGFDADEANA